MRRFVFYFCMIIFGGYQQLYSQNIENEPQIFMRWGNEQRYFYIMASPGFSGFKIGFETLPDDFSNAERSLFRVHHTTALGKGEEFIYAYPDKHFPEADQKSEGQGSYLLNIPRVCIGSIPKKIDHLKVLVPILKDNRVAVYTGAGVSVSAGIPSMSELEALLKVRRDLGFVETVRGFLQEPGELYQSIQQFFDLCFYNTPTPAHYAIRELAETKNLHVLTENLDHLHELSGLQPIRVQPEKFLKVFSPNDWESINFLLCIGLSHDDRGFLAWYKEHNPQGVIIAIDLNCPNYLSDEDFWLPIDIQEALPKLVGLLEEESRYLKRSE